MEAIITAYGVGPITGVIVTIIVLNSGLVGLVIKGVRCLSKILNRMDKVEDKVEHIHEGCHIPVGTMQVVQSDIKDLQEKDNAMSIQLTDMNVTLKKVDVMTTKIYDHFFEEGISSGRRQED